MLGLRYDCAVRLRPLGGLAAPARTPAIDHPETDQNQQPSADWPAHGTPAAVVPDAARKKEGGWDQPCPVEDSAQFRVSRRLVHGVILTGAGHRRTVRFMKVQARSVAEEVTRPVSDLRHIIDQRRDLPLSCRHMSALVIVERPSTAPRRPRKGAPWSMTSASGVRSRGLHGAPALLLVQRSRSLKAACVRRRCVSW